MALGTQFGNNNIHSFVVWTIWSERKKICAVYLRPFCKLAQDVQVSFFVNCAPYDCV